MDLVERICLLSQKFPSNGKFGLVTQMRRAAVSIPSNIAEGYRRRSKADYGKFITYSFGSGSELETQLEIVKRLKYCPAKQIEAAEALLQEVMRIINGLYRHVMNS